VSHRPLSSSGGTANIRSSPRTTSSARFLSPSSRASTSPRRSRRKKHGPSTAAVHFEHPCLPAVQAKGVDQRTSLRHGGHRPSDEVGIRAHGEPARSARNPRGSGDRPRWPARGPDGRERQSAVCAFTIAEDLSRSQWGLRARGCRRAGTKTRGRAARSRISDPARCGHFFRTSSAQRAECISPASTRPVVGWMEGALESGLRAAREVDGAP